MKIAVCKNCRFVDLYLGGRCTKCGGVFVPLLDSAQWNILSPQYQESFIDNVIGMENSDDYYFDEEDEEDVVAAQEEIETESEAEAEDEAETEIDIEEPEVYEEYEPESEDELESETEYFDEEDEEYEENVESEEDEQEISFDRKSDSNEPQVIARVIKDPDIEIGNGNSIFKQIFRKKRRPYY